MLTVFDLGLLGEIVCRIDRRHHSLDSQKGCEVCSVAGDYDQRKEPPDTANDATAVRSRTDIYSLLWLARERCGLDKD